MAQVTVMIDGKVQAAGSPIAVISAQLIAPARATTTPAARYAAPMSAMNGSTRTSSPSGAYAAVTAACSAVPV